MKCYEWRANGQLKRGISIALMGDVPRLQIPPLHDTAPPIEYSLYKTDLEMPCLNKDLAARVLEQTRDQAFLHPEVRLFTCDLEERVQFWALPETEETKNDALLLAVWISTSPTLASIQLEGPAAILAEATAYRGHKDHCGMAKLIRLSEGAQVRFCTQAPLPRYIGLRPKPQASFVCRASGELKRF